MAVVEGEIKAMTVDFDEFVANLTAAGKHWVFAVEGDDWQFVLGRIAEEFFPDEDNDMKNFGVIFPSDDTAPVCWARRSKLPVEVVAMRFGLTREAVEKARIIRLKPLPPPPVEPTVGYYGEA